MVRYQRLETICSTSHNYELRTRCSTSHNRMSYDIAVNENKIIALFNGHPTKSYIKGVSVRLPWHFFKSDFCPDNVIDGGYIWVRNCCPGAVPRPLTFRRDSLETENPICSVRVKHVSHKTGFEFLHAKLMSNTIAKKVDSLSVFLISFFFNQLSLILFS